MGLQYTKRPSQPIGTVRRGVQAAFLALNVWIGVQSYLWVRYFESGGAAVYVPRPPGVEGWLPIASLMNVKYFLLTYSVPDVHPAGMFFRDAGRLTIQVCSVLVILSVVTKNFWCRFLCPYGALMGLASLSSPMRITRDPATCIDCGKCAKACPSLIPVDVLRTVRTPECNGCLTCVSVCPVQDALEMRTLVGRLRVAAPRIALGLALIFVAVVGYAKMTGHWHGQVQEDLFFKLIPIAGTLSHP